MSGLVLHLLKTAYAPLHPTDLAASGAAIARLQTSWRNMRVARHAKYLGLILGPSRGILTYVEPLENTNRALRTGEWRTAVPLAPG